MDLRTPSGAIQADSRPFRKTRPEMQEKDQNQEYRPCDSSRNDSSAPLMPPCCGSGCAVCVLDYWTVDEPGSMPPEEPRAETTDHPHSPEEVEAPADPELVALLEAFEEAQL